MLSDAAPATTWRFGQFYSDMNGTPDAEFVFRGDGTPLSDNAATTPADFAEWLRVVGSPGGYEPGDLVMYAVSANRRVEKATKDSEEYLAGVVTLKPGMVGVSYDIGTDVTDAVGDKDYLELEALYNAKMIAMIGLTPVKVTTENGPLQSGDPITVSSIPGIGMRAEPGDKIIGYAMEAFDPASGEMGTHDVDLPTPIQDQPFHPKTTATTLPNGQSGYKGWVFAHVNLGYSKLDSSTSQVASDTTTNAWSVDQQSGKVNVNFFGNMNMQGNNVLDVGSISGMFGKWKIDADGTLTTVKVVTNEVLTEALSVKSSFELGSMEKPAGMTVYDRTTGEPYCVGIDIGEWFRQKGKCTSVPLSSQSLNSGSSASTSDQVATTTPSASSSEIVSDTLPVEMLSGDTASTTATTTEP
uniref:hypothetical protein n=1 Tax=Nitrospira cf. moscoviensis SBR1015 TaxID=96242 RepID=UPI00117DDB08|nr:hypothetical protein [Nitrospira cf. moscoviensis SBR1015]